IVERGSGGLLDQAVAHEDAEVSIERSGADAHRARRLLAHRLRHGVAVGRGIGEGEEDVENGGLERRRLYIRFGHVHLGRMIATNVSGVKSPAGDRPRRSVALQAPRTDKRGHAALPGRVRPRRQSGAAISLKAWGLAADLEADELLRGSGAGPG